MSLGKNFALLAFLSTVFGFPEYVAIRGVGLGNPPFSVHFGHLCRVEQDWVAGIKRGIHPMDEI